MKRDKLEKFIGKRVTIILTDGAVKYWGVEKIVNE